MSSAHRRRIPPLEEFLHEELDQLCDHLIPEFDAIAGSRLLITGGAGFLGYYLVKAVLHWNRTRPGRGRIELTVCDNYMRGVPDWIDHHLRGNELRVLQHDMILPLPADFGDFEYIVHAAGIASPIFYRAQPLKCIDANINGLRNLLDRCVLRTTSGQQTRGLLFFSSSEIYGDPAPEAIPTSESYRGNVSCTGPRACYDESKRFGETLCVTFARHHGVPVTIARPFNNYGPGLKISDGRVIPDFARDILAKRDIVLLSDGAPTRTFCYVSDAVAGYYKVLVRGRAGEPYNIGIDRPEISVRDLAQVAIGAAAELFGYGGKLNFRRSQEADYLVDNPGRRCPSIAKARQELGFDPRVPIEDGIYRALIWYSHNARGARA